MRRRLRAGSAHRLPRRTSPGRPLVPRRNRRASIGLTDDGRCLRWSVDPADRANEYGLTVSACMTATATSSSAMCEPIGGTCLSAVVGLSPDHHGSLEAARMEPDHRRAVQVEIDQLDSAFLARFSTAQPATSYLMRDVDVTWTKVAAPRLVLTEARP